MSDSSLFKRKHKASVVDTHENGNEDATPSQLIKRNVDDKGVRLYEVVSNAAKDAVVLTASKINPKAVYEWFTPAKSTKKAPKTHPVVRRNVVLPGDTVITKERQDSAFVNLGMFLALILILYVMFLNNFDNALWTQLATATLIIVTLFSTCITLCSHDSIRTFCIIIIACSVVTLTASVVVASWYVVTGNGFREFVRGITKDTVSTMWGLIVSAGVRV